MSSLPAIDATAPSLLGPEIRRMATLYIFSGLPGTGKTTLSQSCARELGAAHVRLDTIEQALRDLCGLEVEGEGYDLACRIASDNLSLGIDVVADSCNLLEVTRRAWEGAAIEVGASFKNVEIVCSDATEHRRRIESRVSSISGLRLPSWEDVQARKYDPWTTERITIDTASRSEKETVVALLESLGLIEKP